MPQTINSFDAGLAKRLAEAADCFRDNLFHYFVCKPAFPYDLRYTVGYESDAAASNEADSLLESLGSTYKKFGPYKTESNEEPAIEYETIKIKFMQGSNELYSETFSSDVDAIILSVSAYDKFLQPYYLRLYGIEVATEFRQMAIAALKSKPFKPLAHLSGNFATSPGTGGTKFVAGQYER